MAVLSETPVALAVYTIFQYKSGGFYRSLTFNDGASNNSGQGRLILMPFWVFLTFKADRIGVNVTVTGSAGSVLRLGCYKDDGTGVPSALFFDAGTIDLTAGTGDMLITINQTFSPGLYWLCAANQGAPVTSGKFIMASGFSALAPTPPANSISNAAYNGANYAVTGVTGALPATVSPGFATNDTLPVVALRAA